VQAHRIGDLAQHQRAHRDLAVREKVLLPIDDGLRHPKNGVEALLDVADQPAGFLQPGRPRRLPFRVLASARRLDGRRVSRVDAQLRHHVRVQLHHPACALLPDEDVGYDVIGTYFQKPYTWMRDQSTNDLLGAAKVLVAAVEKLAQLVEVPCRQQRQVLANDAARQGKDRPLRRAALPHQQVDLQAQALGRVARAHARWVEALQQGQRGGQVVQFDAGLRRAQLPQFLQTAREVAALVERLDQQLHERAVERRRTGCVQLSEQVLAQRGTGGGPGQSDIVVVVALAAAAIAPVEQAVSAAAAAGAAVLARRAGAGLAARVARRYGRAGGKDRAVGGHPHRCRQRVVIALQQRVFHQCLLDLLVQFEGRQLQQADRLL